MIRKAYILIIFSLTSDFKNKSGSVLAFIKLYLDEGAMAFLDRKPKISYIHYNWALNAQAPLE